MVAADGAGGSTPLKLAHAMPFGAEVRDGATRFRLWAPEAARVAVDIHGHGSHEMRAGEPGWHEFIAPGVGAGARYRFLLEGGLAVPDPASRFNPGDVHGASEVIDPSAYEWRDARWQGRPWEEAVIYELHVGAFSPEGTFAAARGRLRDVAETGFTAIELMPVADFAGTRNWGYDGVLLFAPDSAYGQPEDLKAFVDEAHALGLMVLLDVVYNHIGPEGSYLHAYWPQFFAAGRETPWGAAVNFDGPGARTVRDFCMHNALYWLDEYRFDGLRLDAVHAIRDRSALHIVSEIAEAMRSGPGRERQVHLMIENEGADSPPGARARWNEPLHHALHVLATGEDDGYYAGYADAPIEKLGRALSGPPAAMISFLQTHDYVGNRAHGERIHVLADAASERAALGCLLLAPQIPLLFMGEEYAAATPFLFFCDFNPALNAAVRAGRRAEFGRFHAFADPAATDEIADPSASVTFAASKLRWEERSEGAHAERLALVRRLIGLRRKEIVPRLRGARLAGAPETADGALKVEWTMGDGASLRLFARFSAGSSETSVSLGNEMIWRSRND